MSGSPWTSGSWARKPPAPAGSPTRFAPFRRCCELADQMRSHCPDAWLLNFTNPAGMVTEALVPVLGRKVIGIRDSASGLVHRAANAAGAELPAGKLDGVGYYGLNHLGWLYRLESGGRDLLPGLLADAGALPAFEEGRLFPPPSRRTWRPAERIPRHYYETARAPAGFRAPGHPRGESIDRQQTDLYPRLAAAGPAAFGLWDAARRSREEGYLAEARTAGERRDERPCRRRRRTGCAGGHARTLRRRSGGADPEHPQPHRRRRRHGGAVLTLRFRDCPRTPSSCSLPGDTRRRRAPASGASGTGATGPAAAGQGRRTPRRQGGRNDDRPAGSGAGGLRRAPVGRFRRPRGRLLAGYVSGFPELPRTAGSSGLNAEHRVPRCPDPGDYSLRYITCRPT